MTVKVCVSILSKTMSETLNLIEKAENYKADFIEVRLDYLKDCNGKLPDITDHTKVPMIATTRTADCNGKFLGSETERQQILLNAAKSGFEYVDIELSTPKLKNLMTNLLQTNVKSIISFHDFNGTPSFSKLHGILEKAIANRADVCKIVTTAKHVKDNLILLNLLLRIRRKSKIICFSMGKLGNLSRLLSPIFGGFFTIASVEQGKETAPGQLDILQIRTIYQILGYL